MTSQGYWLLKVITGSCAGLCLVTGAWFSVLAALHKTERVREYLLRIWRVIEGTSWMRMPEPVIRWLLTRIESISRGRPIFRSTSFYPDTVAFLLAVLIIFQPGAFVYGKSAGPADMVIFQAAILVTLLLIIPYLWHFWKYYVRKRGERGRAYFWTKYGLGASLLILFCRGLSIYMLVPASAAFSLFAIRDLNLYDISDHSAVRVPKVLSKHLPVVYIGLTCSFLVTALCMLFGHLAHPQAFLPKTAQMFLVNVVLDGLTLVITFHILEWIMAHAMWWRILLGIAFDMMLAALLALLSLYLGTIFTANALTITEVARVLVGMSPDGVSWEIGPFFWTMHTTLIPTILYLSLIGLCWIVKLIVIIPASRFFRRNPAEDHPYVLLIAVCTLFFAAFTSISVLLGAFEERARDLERRQVAAIAPAESEEYPLCDSSFSFVASSHEF